MLLDYLEKLHLLDSIEAVWAHHVASMDTFGFSRLIYGFSRSRTKNSFGDLTDILVLSNHEPDFMQNFVDRELYHHSPMLQWAANNVGAGSWALIPEYANPCDKHFQELAALNQNFGITAGYTISFKGATSRQIAAIGLVGRPGLTQDDVEEIWQEHGRTILQMNNAAHLKMLTLPHEPMERQLTNRQREVLEWVGDGKTIQDIGLIMGLKPATVEKHLRLASEKLNVETTTQAVLKASFNNQIFVIEA